MNAMFELELYNRIVRYLQGRQSLADLRRWYDSASWDHSAWESDMASTAELAFAEFSSGHRTADEVTASLSQAVSRAVLLVPVIASQTTVVSGESQNPVKILPTWVATLTRLGSVAGKLREAEYA